MNLYRMKNLTFLCIIQAIKKLRVRKVQQIIKTVTVKENENFFRFLLNDN
jgi:hypothetical protein